MAYQKKSNLIDSIFSSRTGLRTGSMLFTVGMILVLLLTACGSPLEPYQQATPAAAPTTAAPEENAQPSPDPTPEATPRPISAEDLLGVWVSEGQDYLYLQDVDRAELYLAGSNEILDLSWSCENDGQILFPEHPLLFFLQHIFHDQSGRECCAARLATSYSLSFVTSRITCRNSGIPASSSSSPRSTSRIVKIR